MRTFDTFNYTKRERKKETEKTKKWNNNQYIPDYTLSKNNTKEKGKKKNLLK